MAVIDLVLVLALGAANCPCNYDNWMDTVKATEALAITKPSFIVPQGPLGKERARACVIVTFEIDEKGFPKNVKIEESSKSRSIDMAAKLTAEKYRFLVTDKVESGERFALYFEYSGGA